MGEGVTLGNIQQGEAVSEIPPELVEMGPISRSRFLERISKERNPEEKEELLELLMEFNNCLKNLTRNWGSVN